MDKISFITVTYNASATLEKTIVSIISQSYANIEYLIIDGGSNDGTVDIIKKYQHKISYWISEKDNGIYHAMNKGIKASTGEWIIFFGADDVLYNDKVIENIFSVNTVDQVDFLYGDVILKSKKKIFGGSRTYDTLIAKNINHQSIFYRKSIFEKKGVFNLKYKILSDYAFNLGIFRDDLLIKKYVPGVVTVYNDKGMSNQVIDGNFYEDQLHYFINTDGISHKDPRLQTYFFFYGFAHLLAGNKSIGYKNLFHALTIGKRKFYYLLVTIKYCLSFVGFFKRIKTSFVAGK